eukprot:1103068-Pleurochrysis_carterae.AAC.1
MASSSATSSTTSSFGLPRASWARTSMAGRSVIFCLCTLLPANRSLLHDPSRFLHTLGYGRKGGKVRLNANFLVFIEPFHHDIRKRLPTAALPGPNDNGPAPLRSAKDTLEDALLAAGQEIPEDERVDNVESEADDSAQPLADHAPASESRPLQASRAQPPP